jgi:hypothetical protein
MFPGPFPSDSIGFPQGRYVDAAEDGLERRQNFLARLAGRPEKAGSWGHDVDDVRHVLLTGGPVLIHGVHEQNLILLSHAVILFVNWLQGDEVKALYYLFHGFCLQEI